MLEEKLAAGSSWIHGLDPRAKLVVGLFFSFLIALSNELKTLSLFFALAVILIISIKIDFKYLLKRLLLFNLFICLIWIFIPFTFPGKEILTVWQFSVSKEGLFYALKITLRSNSIILLVISLLSTSPVLDLIHAMSRLRIPPKLIYLLFFVYRYLYVIKKEFNTIHQAMLLRAFKAKTNLHTYRSYAYLIAMLLIKSYERSQKVYQAMICRGFKGDFVMIDHFKLKQKDYLFIIVSSLFLIFLLAIEKGLI
ncbi:cobalt/nickel transport system permease protein [Halanaerobium congolense]|jgi:cobalt/nickel transport system permease protein|uniref:Cobalt/nickel transport system permease protein n=1 Tax=Halanaerobium congolense TaxID=54121 RepID=A0A1I0CFN2_9FIRM|nr:cobalt ECF transporter T component CbiQ [Halanaerobium congolense]PTX16009.1 cobalt/nickel transport system permease protein [Halanaerobium congolense]SDG00115.1 cobalt/nickel transport system permease protein [Halanaerobium congolense]SET18414.1 cobalt/nickel transport system permease protein [Halanaerobium congolense]SFP66012.1 cobalt/nickel transport system permease protein [Halanaerobium congolense]